MTKKFTFDDLQPRVEMLIDALENRGACASGLPYAPSVKNLAEEYKIILSSIKAKTLTIGDLEIALDETGRCVMSRANGNQVDRLRKIVEALDFYMMREYNKLNN